MRHLGILIIVGLLVSSANDTLATDDLSPSFDQVIRLLELDPLVTERALSGEIIMVDREDSMYEELATGLIAVVKKPYAYVSDVVKADRLFQFHQHILEFAQIVGVPDASKFHAIGYIEADIEEVRAILAIGPAICSTSRRLRSRVSSH
jgi:hypothetical protein